jgi:CheY-like chemotaxis protein
MNKDLTVIITDDDEGHTILIKRTLQRLGIANIVAFNNGQDTLDFFYEKNFSNGNKYILLLDLRMPEITGLDVLKELKASTKLKNIPVIIVTTTDDPTEMDLCHKNGCNYYLTKPIEMENFVRAFQSVGVFN